MTKKILFYKSIMASDWYDMDIFIIIYGLVINSIFNFTLVVMVVSIFVYVFYEMALDLIQSGFLKNTEFPLKFLSKYLIKANG